MTGATENQQAARRSDATRATILDAARERFVADGYEKATIRAIARDAKIDPSMVMRYYGNKAGLFAAAVAIDPGLPACPSNRARRSAVRWCVTSSPCGRRTGSSPR